MHDEGPGANGTRPLGYAYLDWQTMQGSGDLQEWQRCWSSLGRRAFANGPSMSEVRSAPRIVLCEDDDVLLQRVSGLASDAGLDIVGVTSRWAQAIELVVENEADAIVIDVATVGAVGIRVVRSIRELAPSCEILMISPLDMIDLVALDAGASIVVSPSDLRPLAASMARLAAAGTHTEV